MNNKKIVLEGRDIHKEYKKDKRHTKALEGVSFTLHEAEILGIVGESGSGKSTLLNIISGIEKPDSGNLFHDGEGYTGQSVSKTGQFLRVIFQDAYRSFDPRMTMMKSLKESMNASDDEIKAITSEVGLNEELLNRKPRELSGGQCQRMSIARALLSKVGIILCDEITSALDVTTQAQVVKLLLELREKEKLSMIFVSHDLALVSALCDRVMVLKDGKCVEEGDTSEVITNPAHIYTKELLSCVIKVV